MSPHAQTSFVNDLVVMAKAYEELPGVREELRATRDQLEAAQATVQRLELKLMDRANEINDKARQINDLEVAVTSAELRFLEADDRTEKALAFVRTTFGNAGQLLQALEPPKPAIAASEPVPEAPQGPFGTSEKQSSEHFQEPEGQSVSSGATAQDQPLGNSFSERTEGAVSVQQDPTSTAHTPTSLGSPQGSIATPVEAMSAGGQSEPVSVPADPTASSMDAPSTSALSIAESTDTAKSEGTGNANGPYSGKRYYDNPVYIPLPDWLAGGGTEEDYNWRPNQQMIG